jgi:AmmeMemoRadiSam system protein A
MNEYSSEERKRLLRLAHQSIAAELYKTILDTTPPSEHLAEPRGAFTTLHADGALRGCIGYIIPVHSLYQTVAETATAAAFRDPRFAPVGESELETLQIEISVLSPMAPIRPEEVEVGRHGLLIVQDTARGLLLPQVATEWGWDRERFLSETCRKAGLAPDAWQHGASIEAFTAEVFGEKAAGESLQD